MLKVKKRWRWALLLLTIVGAVAAAGRLYWLWKYPFGWSHSCDKGLMFALRDYADAHDGAYPAGEATPEASLSLLYPMYANGSLLQGKTVPLEVVKSILESGNRLGPDSCGWHYVEGLRSDDDPRLGLCWDKVGLGHNGERLTDGGHTVIFVRTDSKYIPGSEWQAFLEEQEALLAARSKVKLQR